MVGVGILTFIRILATDRTPGSKTFDVVELQIIPGASFMVYFFMSRNIKSRSVMGQTSSKEVSTSGRMVDCSLLRTTHHSRNVGCDHTNVVGQSDSSY